LKKNKFLLGGTILMLAAKSVWGAETASNDQNLHYGLGDYYKAGELSLDGFGSASLGQFTSEQPSNESTRQDIRFGAGAGVNYFITRYFGIGADAYSENTTGTFIDSTSASLILRRPLGQSGFAPYAFGGGGRHFDAVRAWFAQAGVGVEYRFSRHVGVFLDARGVLPNETKYYGVARFGMRFNF
jgi:hypothetical protein